MADKEKKANSGISNKNTPSQKKKSSKKTVTTTKKKPTTAKKTSAKKSAINTSPKSKKTRPKKNNDIITGPVESLPEKKPIQSEMIDKLQETSAQKPSIFERIMGRGRAIDRIEGNSPEDEEEIDPDAIARGDRPMGVVDHLDEIRTRLMYILGTMFFILCVTFYFSDPIVDYIAKPFLMTGFKLNIFKITGGFMLKLKASMIIALLIGIPLIVYHIWAFIKPAVSTKERKFARIVILATILLFYAGICFVFYVFMPTALKIMLDFIGPNMTAMIGADDYFSFLIFFCIAMGVLFELPIFILILTKIGLITPFFLTSKRKYAIVIMWILAAVITPQPDMISQAMVAIPLMILYEISIVISKLVYRKKQRELLS